MDQNKKLRFDTVKSNIDSKHTCWFSNSIDLWNPGAMEKRSPVCPWACHNLRAKKVYFQGFASRIRSIAEY